MTLLVRDEADIIASNIDFHLDQGVDFIIATDNLSVDGTTNILRHYERQGVLHYIHEPRDDYAQDQWVSLMARMACTDFAADWVINSDADEFWLSERGDLKQALNDMPASCDALSAERVNFLPRPMIENSFFADVMIIRERQSLTPLGEALPPKVCHRAFGDILVGQGNHFVGRGGRWLDAVPVPITILHFPMRSYHQFANKIVKGGRAYERNANLHLGGTWRQLYELWKNGELEPYYRASVPDDAAIERGLLDGSLVRDERLKHALLKLRTRSPSR